MIKAEVIILHIIGIVWLDNIVEKLHIKHAVSQAEVKDVFNNNPKFRFAEKGMRAGEDVYAALGKTDAGRYLIVFFILKKNGYAVVVSGRNMSDNERKLYAKK
jgi:uncharacterized DUF497 family protein